MRPPRFRFPDEVRSTTRTIASRMVSEGEVATTPEELDAWLAQRPDVRARLESGGYGTHFTSADLFPLLQVFVVKAGGAPPGPQAPPRTSMRRWIVAFAAVAVLAVVLVAVLIAVNP